MAERLRLVSGREAVKKLERAGWTLVRRRGSHMMLTHPNYRWTISVPDHREIGPGLLRSIIRQAGLSVADFNSL
jgi:predicted RNA binding protein YcfA (HicA-like mRNA interferase family)